ncbi:MAG: glycosyl transferase [Humidesulfovibrio sp.]|uniref:glycosyltransferase family 2 protein n=1 Tax=Humidesulfovibrio sp. TaxID=2910988 RepID=UPI0027E76A4A|nr:glycosyl transferase [Humidesulfovibrio sp.]MDQ7836521.1 glycosyl transferase [Humidesulfovibrio sp.]
MPKASPDMLFSVITPSIGTRPRALAQAIGSVEAAVEAARATQGLDPARVEMLVGFDAVDGARPSSTLANLRFFVLPRPACATCGFGNHIRDALMRGAKGRYLLFLDDDNALAEGALAAFLPHVEAAAPPELLIGRVDTSRAFDVPFLPRPAPAGTDPVAEAIRQGNIDPLCLCIARELAVVRGRGWADEGGYESDYLNIRRYHRRARGVVLLDAEVGVYDAGRGLDPQGLNPRQARAEQASE